MGSSPLRKILFAASIAGLAVAGLAGSAGAGGSVPLDAPLTIAKTVHGPVPAGTTFTAHIACDDDIIVSGGGTVDAIDVTFDATGQATTQATFGFDDPGTCTVSETADGGAATVSYACAGDLGQAGAGDFAPAAVVDPEVCATTGPQADPITVNIVNPGQMATVTIDNTFVAPEPPTPAPELVLQPKFPG
jgi:hypothetical protein